MTSFLDRIGKIKAKRAGVRIQDIGKISSNSHLVMEEHSRLGNVSVNLPQPERKLHMGAYSYMRGGGEILHVDSIGRFCSIGRNVVLGQPSNNHPIDWVSSSMSVSNDYVAECNYTSIGNDVWICHDAVIMAGVKIADGAVIGRNAVVTKDVGSYQIVAGNPGKVVRARFSTEQIAALQESQWWDSEFPLLSTLSFEDVDRFLRELPTERKTARYKTVSIQGKRVRVA
jgi:acetyltransferase-like isoleucine patch superfamily enzyme